MTDRVVEEESPPYVPNTPNDEEESLPSAVGQNASQISRSYKKRAEEKKEGNSCG